MKRLMPLIVIGALVIVLSIAQAARAQGIGTPITPIQTGGNMGGVYIDPDGTVGYRETDEKARLSQIRMAAANARNAALKDGVRYLSLPTLFAQVKQLTEAGKDIPDELRYLGGMTQLQYVLVYPEQKDLIIAGPAEPFDASNKLQPFGKRTGRPVMQLDDLVVAMRLAVGGHHGRFRAFGCSIDPVPDALDRTGKVMRDYAGRPRSERMEAMRDALGPQRVSVFGAAADTRLAYTCVAADYRLKRISLGIEPVTVPGVGVAVDSSRRAGSRVWFEASYDALLVSPDSDAFELRGPRLLLKAGALSFDERGATDAAINFAKRFTRNVPALAAAVPMFADLQNLADLSVLAALIREDKLDTRVQWDASWALDPNKYHVAVVPVPRTAQTLVAYTNGSLVAGGVSLNVAPYVAPSNRKPAEQSLLTARQRIAHMRLEKPGVSGTILLTNP